MHMSSPKFFSADFPSKIIADALQKLRKEDTSTCVAVFYYDYMEQWSVDKLSRSIIFQLLEQMSEYIPPNLRALHKSSVQKPSAEALLPSIRGFAEHVKDVFILVDAIDEVPNDQLDRVMTYLTKMTDWSASRVHILVTSRISLAREPWSSTANYLVTMPSAFQFLPDKGLLYPDLGDRKDIPADWLTKTARRIAARAGGV